MRERTRILICSFLAAWVVLTVVGSLGLGALLLVGDMLHGEPIGGPFGLLLVPFYAGFGSLVALLFLAAPLCLFFQWLFDRRKWRPGLRWWIVPFTGPAFFCVLEPIFVIPGNHVDLLGDTFAAAADSFFLGTTVSCCWVACLLLEPIIGKKKTGWPSV